MATLVAAWAAARLSARRITRIRPAEALAEASAESGRIAYGRLLAGTLALIGGVVLLAVLSRLRTEPAAMPTTYLTVIVACVAVALLGPLLAKAALTLLGIPLRLFRTLGRLAAGNARAESRRLATVITPLTLLTGMACTLVFVQGTLGDAAERQVRAGVRADRVIGSSGAGVPDGAADRIRALPGVNAVTEVVHTTVRSTALDKYTVQGVTPGGIGATIDPKVTDGSLAGLGEKGVAVSDTVAEAKGLSPGDPLKLVLGDGTPVTLTVAARYERGLGFGDLTMDHALVARHIDSPLSDAVLVAAEGDGPGEGPSDAELTAALADFPGTAVRDGSYLADRRAAEHEANAEVNYVAMGLVLAFTTIASVNTLAMSTAGRSREFALLRLAGLTRRQVLRMLRLEALAVALVAVAFGTVISTATVTAFSIGVTGEAQPYLSLPVQLAVTAAAAALALLAVAVPARASLRERPTDVIGT